MPDRMDPPTRPDHPAVPSSDAALLSRRHLLVVGAGIVLAGCAKSTSRADPSNRDRQRSDSGATSSPGAEPAATSTAATSVPAGCVLTPELTAGPYYLDGPLARADITEGRPGTPLEFHVRVLALPTCVPLERAAVDIWHCDAGGEYSGFNGNSLEATRVGGTNNKRFLRGVQLTDADGVATFTTIFPGWYEGRTVHIHLKVLDGGTLATSYTGGHVAHVGQAFFDEATTAEILSADPYRAHTGIRTTNDGDSIYGQAGPSAVATLRPRRSGPGTGYAGMLTCIVDPHATPPSAPLF